MPIAKVLRDAAGQVRSQADVDEKVAAVQGVYTGRTFDALIDDLPINRLVQSLSPDLFQMPNEERLPTLAGTRHAPSQSNFCFEGF